MKPKIPIAFECIKSIKAGEPLSGQIGKIKTLKKGCRMVPSVSDNYIWFEHWPAKAGETMIFGSLRELLADPEHFKPIYK